MSECKLLCLTFILFNFLTNTNFTSTQVVVKKRKTNFLYLKTTCFRFFKCIMHKKTEGRQSRDGMVLRDLCDPINDGHHTSKICIKYSPD